MITFKLDTGGLDNLAKRYAGLAEGKARPAIAAALNRAGDAAATALGRELAAQTGLAARATRQLLVTKSASAANLMYTIVVPGRHLTLARFAPRETKKGVSAAPWAKRRVFGGTFLARGQVFARLGRPRLPIRTLYGPSLGVEVQRGGAIEAATARAQEVFSQRATHELARALKAKG